MADTLTDEQALKRLAEMHAGHQADCYGKGYEQIQCYCGWLGSQFPLVYDGADAARAKAAKEHAQHQADARKRLAPTAEHWAVVRSDGTLQPNLVYETEAEAIEKCRVALGETVSVVALHGPKSKPAKPLAPQLVPAQPDPKDARIAELEKAAKRAADWFDGLIEPGKFTRGSVAEEIATDRRNDLRAALQERR